MEKIKSIYIDVLSEYVEIELENGEKVQVFNDMTAKNPNEGFTSLQNDVDIIIDSERIL